MDHEYKIGQRVMVKIQENLFVSARVGGTQPGFGFLLLYAVVLDEPLSTQKYPVLDTHFEGWFAFSVPAGALSPI